MRRWAATQGMPHNSCPNRRVNTGQQGGPVATLPQGKMARHLATLPRDPKRDAKQPFKGQSLTHHKSSRTRIYWWIVAECSTASTTERTIPSNQESARITRCAYKAVQSRNRSELTYTLLHSQMLDADSQAKGGYLG
eukprot:1195435-Prorocentrum_minimum.AAC.11